MTTLSAALIVRDEEAVLGRILDDVRDVADEIVVVDTGSVDDTVDIAARGGARVLQHAWTDDFAAARNASFAGCTGDWILWLDADDRLPAPAREALLRWKSELLSPQLDAVSVPYLYHWSADGRFCTHRHHRERLLRRAAQPVWHGRVHEVVDVPGTCVQREDVWVEHRPPPERRQAKSARNLRILQAAVEQGDRSARTLLYYANELRDAERPLEALAMYEEYLQQAPVGWERHAALLWAAGSAALVGQVDQGLALARQAIAEEPTRAEGWAYLGSHHFALQEWGQALPYFAAAASLTAPHEGFVDQRWYSYLAWDHLSVCLQRVGRGQEALEALARAVRGNPDRERLADNAALTVRLWDADTSDR